MQIFPFMNKKIGRWTVNQTNQQYKDVILGSINFTIYRLNNKLIILKKCIGRITDNENNLKLHI